MTHSDLSQILIDGHSSLLTKLLTQNALTARCLITKFIQRKGTFQASRQPGNQLIQQRFAGCWRQRITGCNDGDSATSPTARTATQPFR
ncbi:Uncharacterised protein [Escherichia coli]|uniref:Uncharacterized protein n=1 Tax=Escherichia coli TaxID=562 RepID=A0A377KET5_ECOLX|nr:Uncharacterised protein [Escherichia coli]